MSFDIRTYQPGDEEKQAAIFNAAAASLPGFKSATVSELLRRTRAGEFDPATRLYAIEGDQVIGYCIIQKTGRIGYPWCIAGHNAQEQLLAAALTACAGWGINRVFSAYRADWVGQASFFERNGFRKTREMMNFAQNLLDLPTMVIRRGLNVTRVKPEDLVSIAAMGSGAVRVSQDRLAKHLFSNPYFPPESVFVLRKADESPQAVGILINNPHYANPLQIDAAAPCFRLGAFGTEEMSVKRVNGLFSFLVRDDSDSMPLALDLLSYALGTLQDDTIETLAAQVPSDAKHLLNFYQRYFRKQGSFPVFERELT